MKRILEISMVALLFMGIGLGVFLFSPSPCSAGSDHCGKRCYENSDCVMVCSNCIPTDIYDVHGVQINRCIR